MKNDDFKRTIPDMPLSFVHAMNETLERIEKMNAGKRRMNGRKMLICACFIIALIGTAIAAGEYRVFGFLGNIKPLEGARKMIKTNVGASENEYLRIDVEEALYDGRGILIQMRATPLKPDTHPLYSSCVDVRNDPDWAYEETVKEDGGLLISFDGRNDGKDFVRFSVFASLISENGSEVFIRHWKAMYDESMDGSIVLYADGFDGEDLDGNATVNLRLRSYLCAHDMKKTDEIDLDDIHVPVLKTGDTWNYTLVPVTNGGDGSFLLNDARISFSKVRGYITLDYLYIPKDLWQYAVMFDLFLPDGTQIAAGKVRGEQHAEKDGYYRGIEHMEIQSFETLPETIIIRAKIYGDTDDPTDIECRAVRE